MEDREYADNREKADEEEDAGKKKGALMREMILNLLGIFVTAFILSQVMVHFVVINAEVPSESMENSIRPGDRLFGFRLAYTFHKPERFDVVIFRYPVDETQNFIKRVIGLPGETVEIREGKIYIDGAPEPLDEPYLPEQWTQDNDGYFFKVPGNSYLMLGDNRNISLDARFWAQRALAEHVAATEEEAQRYAFVTDQQILGRAVMKYYPGFKSLLAY